MSSGNMETFPAKPDQLLELWSRVGVDINGREGWPAAIERGDYAICFALLDGEPAGSGTVRYDGVRPEQARFGEVVSANFPEEGLPIPAVYDVVTRPDMRRQGVGTAVMEEIHRNILNREGVANRAVLSVGASNLAARGLYKSLGYEQLRLGGKPSFRMTTFDLLPDGGLKKVRRFTTFMAKELEAK